MKDGWGRDITYLRIALTDLCNLRCRYCMPEEGVVKRAHADILSMEEIVEIVSEAANLGICKIRLTGGEPLLRKGVLPLCERLAGLPGIEELTLTSNGILLPQMAKDLKRAGVKRVNISLDTLDAEKYKWITRGGDLNAALAGVYAAVEAGLDPVKINTVLVGGFNDDEISKLVALTERWPIDLRFIELMPIGHISCFAPESYLASSAVLEKVPQLQAEQDDNGVAERYRLPGAVGRVGLISPLSRKFCKTCNRVRLTSDGYMKSCLHSAEEILVRGLHGMELRKQIERAILHKPAEHGGLSAWKRSHAERDMNQIGG